MKKWLLALMICLSFSTLTVGIFLLPQTINAVYQREQNSEEDEKSEVQYIPGGYSWDSTVAVRTITLSMNGKTASNSPTAKIYANSLSNVVFAGNGSIEPFSVKKDEDSVQEYGAVTPTLLIGDMVHYAKVSLSGKTARTANQFDNTDSNWTMPQASGYTFQGFYSTSSSSGGTQYINSSGSIVGSPVSYGIGGSGTWYARWTAAATQYTDYIDHWSWGYQNSEGNNGDGSAYKITTTSFSAAQGSSYTMGSGRGVACPNGFYMASIFGTSSISGSWANYSMGTSVTQNAGSMYYEYDYYPYTYQITYTMNGGTNSSSNPSSYNVLYGVTFSNPTRTGYTFAGWYIDGSQVTGINPGATASFASNGTSIYDGVSGRTTGNKTVVAQWTANNYLVTYNLNGGEYINPTVFSSAYNASSDYVLVNGNNVTIGESTVLLDNFYSGDTFTVVSDMLSGSASSNGCFVIEMEPYSTRNQIDFSCNASTSGSREITSDLQSQGRQVRFWHWHNTSSSFSNATYRIKLSLGRSKARKSVTYASTYGQHYVAYRTGYTFSGWYTAASGGSKVTNSTTVSTASNHTLYAHWTINSYTLTAYANSGSISSTTGWSGTGSSATKSVNYAASYGTLPTVSRSNYNLKGWYTSSSGGSQVSSSTTIGAGNANIYAQWTAISKTITLKGRVVGKDGNVVNADNLGGAVLTGSYTTVSSNVASSATINQSNGSGSYTMHQGSTLAITPTVPSGYKYLGYSTSASSKPSVSSFPTSSSITVPSSNTTYYFYFQQIAAPLYYTTERGGYWYYEDGEYPQTFVGTSITGATANQSSPKFHLDWPTDNNNGDYTIYTLGASRYIQVASPMTGTIKFNGQTVSLTAGTKYWFRIDPIRWRVSEYGAAANKYSLASVTSNLMGISDVLGHGRVNTNASIKDTQNMTNDYQDCAAVGYTNAKEKIYRDMYTYQEGSSTKTNIHIEEVDQPNKLLVATLERVQSNGLQTYASDLSAMLQCRDYNNSSGWTSSMYNLGSGIAVGPGNSYIGKYWGQLNDGTYNTYGFVYAHQASYATCLGGNGGLASGYTVVEYIQSDGNQFIDTGWCPNYALGFTVNIDYAPSALGNRYCLLSNYNSNNHISLEVSAGNQSRYYINGSGVDNYLGTVSTSRNNSIFSYSNGTYTHNCNGNQTTGSYSMAGETTSAYLFVDRALRYSTFSSALKIYKCKIYDKGVLARDFIPVRRDTDGVYGLYDLVTQMFFTNAGSGSFTGGAVVGTAMNYLQSSGSQFINTGYYVTSQSSVEVEFANTSSTTSSNWEQVLGARSSYHSAASIQVAYNTSTQMIGLDYGNNTGGTQIVEAKNTRIKVRMTPVGHTVNGAATTNQGVFTGSCAYPLWLFDDNDAGNHEKYFNGKIYSVKIYESGSLTRYFIPLKNTSGTLGLYDLVNGTFYTNQGSGSFTAG